jgi:hypothetical protein
MKFLTYLDKYWINYFLIIAEKIHAIHFLYDHYVCHK